VRCARAAHTASLERAANPEKKGICGVRADEKSLAIAHAYAIFRGDSFGAMRSYAHSNTFEE